MRGARGGAIAVEIARSVATLSVWKLLLTLGHHHGVVGDERWWDGAGDGRGMRDVGEGLPNGEPHRVTPRRAGDDDDGIIGGVVAPEEILHVLERRGREIGHGRDVRPGARIRRRIARAV